VQANSAVLDMDPWADLLGLSSLDTSPEEWLESQFFDLSGRGGHFFNGGIAKSRFARASPSSPLLASAGIEGQVGVILPAFPCLALLPTPSGHCDCAVHPY